MLIVDDAGRVRTNGWLLERFVPSITSIPVYLRGPDEMMDLTGELLRKIGVPYLLVRIEVFAGKKFAVTASNETEVATIESKQTSLSRVGAMKSAMNVMVTSTVRLSTSVVLSERSGETTILEVAKISSVSPPFECRSGFCGKLRLALSTCRSTWSKKLRGVQ